MKKSIFQLQMILLFIFMGTACNTQSIDPSPTPPPADTPLPPTPTTQSPTPTVLPANTFGTVDNSSLQDKVVVGYQGWFGCPNDGSVYDDWIHWFQYDGISSVEKLSVDFWPDVSELSPDELCPTGMTDAQGDQMYAFSNYNPLSVLRHFYWMAQYGIDGVELQRFASVFPNYGRTLHQDQVMRNAWTAAESYGRVFYIQYAGVERSILRSVRQDWMRLIDEQQITSSPSYLHHEGLPIVGLWGLGFKNKELDPQEALDLIDFFQNHPDPRYRATVQGGVPSYWRTLSVDSKEETAWAEVYRALDIINPWHVNSIYDLGSADTFLQNVIIPDLAETRTLGIDYMPVIFPGFSWNNIMHDGYNKTPRDGGLFLWELANNVIAQDVEMIEVAMFDEVDEGTAIFKVVETADQLPPGEVLIPLDADGYELPSDWYLLLVGNVTKVLRGEMMIPVQIEDLPERTVRNYLPVYLEITSASPWNTVQILNPEVVHSVEVTSMEGALAHFSAKNHLIVMNQSLVDGQAGKTIKVRLEFYLDPSAGSTALELLLTKGNLGITNLRFYTVIEDVETTIKQLGHTVTNDDTGTNPLRISLSLDLAN